MYTLEGRGLFWWSDETIPKRQFAPANSVNGLLKIDNDGRIALELDGILPSERGPFASLAGGGETIDRSIAGVLHASGDRILLTDVINDGGEIRSSSISVQRFIAMNCLVGDEILSPGNASLTFKSLEITLSGFEGWLRLGSINISRSPEQLSAEYTKPPPATYEVDDSTVALNFQVSGKIPVGARSDHFSINEAASIVYSPHKLMPLKDLRLTYGLLEDLFILLTDSPYRLDWPLVSTDKGIKYRWYFVRMKSGASVTPPTWYECWTSFPQLRDTFGVVWSNWKRKREEFGPGFYLYLGTRRGVPLYTEHRFVNLIWGIEAFHRTKHSTDVPSDAHKVRMKRIIDAVTTSMDKRWLRGKLKYAYEPPLSNRIFDAFKGLPVDLDSARLRKFADSCAKARNDISHFGGHRSGGVYSDFVMDLDKKCNALSLLYHCLLLNEIGVDEKILRSWFYEGYRSYANKWYLVETGLLDENVLKPQNGKPKTVQQA